MTFLAGWTGIAIAAGLTIPPLVALYFLKLKRRVVAVPSTFLWKRAVEDLHVNSPFQKLRRNLLLLLQLLVLLLAAFTLGKPIRQAARDHEDTLVLLIDHSASMNVIEEDGCTRLDMAKDEAKKVVERMNDAGRAMVVAFCDRSTVISSFDSDKTALKRKIDSIEPTQSSTRLGEAVALAEAYSQNLIIAGVGESPDVPPPTSSVPLASAMVFTDGRIHDLDTLSLKRLDAKNMQMVSVGKRADNVGITAMSARRNYEQPDVLTVFAEIRNFGPEATAFDAVLYVNGEHRDVQSVRLESGGARVGTPNSPVEAGGAGMPSTEAGDVPPSPSAPPEAPPTGSVASVAFDPFDFAGSGVVEVKIEHDDALAADNRAWAVIDPPRHVSVLLVTPGNLFLERVLPTLPLAVQVMSPDEYESAAADKLADGGRSKFDVVMFDGHSTKRLYQGNYFFWGAVPLIEGVSMGELIETEQIYNWDESHPILRHVAVETIQVYQWNKLNLPRGATPLMEGESSPVMSYLAREGSQYLIAAFRLVVPGDDGGEPMMNTFWVTKAHFPVFMYNAIQYLASSLSAASRGVLRPGEPVSLAVPGGRGELTVQRPDGGRETLATGKAAWVHYGKTRQVGVYRAEPAVAGQEQFAVNLFSAQESSIEPAARLTVGTTAVAVAEGTQLANEPLWPHLLLAALAILLIEWVVYNKRVFV